jgi:hypothetical protein
VAIPDIYDYQVNGLEKELKKIIEKFQKKSGLKKAIYLNNDHGMLPNGKYLLDHILKER